MKLILIFTMLLVLVGCTTLNQAPISEPTDCIDTGDDGLQCADTGMSVLVKKAPHDDVSFDAEGQDP